MYRYNIYSQLVKLILIDFLLLGPSNASKLAWAVGIWPSYNENHYFVTRNGKKNVGEDNVYFLEHHLNFGNIPENPWLGYDRLGDIALGGSIDIIGR